MRPVHPAPHPPPRRGEHVVIRLDHRLTGKPMTLGISHPCQRDTPGMAQDWGYPWEAYILTPKLETRTYVWAETPRVSCASWGGLLRELARMAVDNTFTIGDTPVHIPMSSPTPRTPRCGESSRYAPMVGYTRGAWYGSP